ncbi:MAG TPA: methylmalonyl Co-A mutase-associated GTPase MeaB, partial [Spirochaetes bacterium]|nr:methylmalonyl Co-A mutase-associated GTPase MeaB [Spirochaetota bacterium]
GGALGGVARKTRETMLVCEAAGFDVILVETVGVGQSEITVRSMVDFFLLLMIAGAGDELQGIKKGIMEIADSLVINKADGDNRAPAEAARNEYERALHYLQPATRGWQTRVYTCSALRGEGMGEVWAVVEEFVSTTRRSGEFGRRRRTQALNWMRSMLEEHLSAVFYKNPRVAEILPAIEKAVVEGTMPPTAAAAELIEVFEGRR